MRANIGIQTFTIRKAQKRNIRAAYLPLIELGIRKFEIARMDFSERNALAVRELIDEFGIEVVAIQVKPKDVFHKVEKVVDFCKTVGCTRVVISMLPFGCILGSEAKFYDFIATLDGWYDTYKEYGITLAYHHHNWEYVRLSSGKTRMDELLERTERIRIVHDTYWTARSGIAPEREIGRFGNRLIGIHLRDLAHSRRLLDVVPHDTAIGEGVIDFGRVLSAAEAVGCEYYVIEQKTNKPYPEIEKSFRYLSEI